MPVEITARHVDATDAMQDYARRRATAVLEQYPKVEHVHVILDVEKYRCIAEVVVQSKQRHRFESKESSERMLSSVDAAMAKVEKQLQRVREKVHDHKAAMKQGETERKRRLKA